MDQAYKHILTYTSLTLSTTKDIIGNLSETKKKKIWTNENHAQPNINTLKHV